MCMQPSKGRLPMLPKRALTFEDFFQNFPSAADVYALHSEWREVLGATLRRSPWRGSTRTFTIRDEEQLPSEVQGRCLDPALENLRFHHDFIIV